MTAFTLRVLRDEADHEAALEELERLWGAPDGTPEADRLGVLTLLIDDYERRAHALERPDPIDAILFRMEAQGLTRRDLERFIGSSGRVSEVLSRKRGLSLEMIRRLHAGLGLPLEVLVQPTGAPEAAPETQIVEVIPLSAEGVQVVAHDPTSRHRAIKSFVAMAKKVKAKKGKGHHYAQGSVTIAAVTGRIVEGHYRRDHAVDDDQDLAAGEPDEHTLGMTLAENDSRLRPRG